MNIELKIDFNEELQAFIKWAVRNQYDVSRVDDLDDSLFKRQSTEHAWLGWLYSAKAKAENLEGCAVLPLEDARYFSNDGENYEVHETLEQAKHEAECAIEHYSERLADQLMDPTSDGNFHQIGYGIILAESTYSIDHVVTQEDIDNGEYSYEVGTQIMTLSLVEAARGGNDE